MIGDTDSSVIVICDENQNEDEYLDKGDHEGNDDDNEKGDDKEEIFIRT